jgi:hypothetical protein
MKRLLLINIVIFAASSFVLGQSSTLTAIAKRADALNVDSIPLSDELIANPKVMANSPQGIKKIAVDNTDGVKGEAEKRFWVSTEYLVWEMKGERVPALATTSSPFTDVVFPQSRGVLNQPGTSVLFGDSVLKRGRFSGGRVVAGFWLNADRTIGVEGSYFFLQARSLNFSASSSGGPGSRLISRPFFNVNANLESSTFVAVPTLNAFGASPINTSGSIFISAPTHLQGAESNLVFKLGREEESSSEVLAGFRYLSLKEQLNIVTSTNYNIPAEAQKPFLGLGGVMDKSDQFATSNSFFGGQVGVRTGYGLRRLNLELSGKLAFGVNQERVEINGSTTYLARRTNSAPVGFGFAGGVLALPTNIGHYARNKFTFFPEGSVRLSYALKGHLSAFVGYELLYLTNVLRPGEQIDRTVNPFLIPLELSFEVNNFPPFRPSFSFKDSSFWAQGLMTGVRLRF